MLVRERFYRMSYVLVNVFGFLFVYTGVWPAAAGTVVSALDSELSSQIVRVTNARQQVLACPYKFRMVVKVPVSIAPTECG